MKHSAKEKGSALEVKTIFGGTIAVVLLGIYVHLLRVAYLIVDCASNTECTTHRVSDFNEVMAQTLNVIVGLVSALVIAELAVTKPGEVPVARNHPDVLPPLTSVGQAWLGLAVASAYAYFGIKPE